MVGERPTIGAFATMAQVLITDPAPPDGVVEVDEDWQPLRGAATSADHWRVWGRLPARGLSPLRAIGFAVSRERAIRRLRSSHSGAELRRLHRLPPASHAGRLRGAMRSLLLQGAVAELGAHGRPAPYERILQDSGTLSRRLEVSRDGSVRMFGTRHGQPVVVRMSVAGGQSDPARAAQALTLLAERRIDRVPVVLDAGQFGHVGWSVETRLRGRSPGRLNAEHWREVIDIMQQLISPGRDSPDLASASIQLAALLPSHGSAIEQAVAPIAGHLHGMPSAIQHGDLFVDNLLVDRGRLTGIVDWGTWSSIGTPGVDLFELYTTSRRRRGPAEFVRELVSESWCSEEWRRLTASYWAGIGVEPNRPTLRAVATAWWVTSMTSLLARSDRTHLASDRAWLAREVDGGLAWIGATT